MTEDNHNSDGLTRLRIFLRDGYYYDADLTVPWPDFIRNLVTNGYVAFNDAYFERELIGKITRSNPAAEGTATILHLVPKGNA